MEYSFDAALEARAGEIISRLGFSHIDPSRVKIIRSRGTKSRRTLARIHTLPKAVQKALSIQPHYVIEVISENFDRLSEEDQHRTLIHELMHIPHSFGGGFRHHRPFVNRKSVERMFSLYKEKAQE